ncbi:MAG: hypothetical protein K2K88_09670 [Muribaculaceae bacterium]|nr:hypothetical protein [Muribaculaceae bacterium]MDE7092442.1 hypothetical protein [Muribaculaceae bacterium]
MKKSKLILGVSAVFMAMTATSCMGAFLDVSDGPFDYVSGPVFAPDPIYTPAPVFTPSILGPLYSPLPPSRPNFYPGPGPVVRPNRPVVSQPNRPVTLPDNVPVYTNGGINGNHGENSNSNGQRPGANTRR